MPNTKKYPVPFFNRLSNAVEISYGRMANWNSIPPGEQAARF
jgi:hypothetical protein